MTGISESGVEDTLLEWFDDLGYACVPGQAIAPGAEKQERARWGDVILGGRFADAVARLNPRVPKAGIEEAVRRVLHPDTPGLALTNREFHRRLRDGVDVDVHGADGRLRGEKVWLFDFENPDNNDWLVVNQFTMKEGAHTRRPDVVVFVNGLPLAVIELKNPGDENATLKGAYHQIETYKREISGFFHTNEIIVISDGLQARHGTISSNWERFLPWRTVDGDRIAGKDEFELEVLVRGMFEKRRLLDLVRNFVVWEDGDRTLVKKMAAYHQYHAVNKAVEATVRASAPTGDRRVGVVWHTQGSGKSISMVFYAAKVMRHPRMENPTLVVLTDRNDLDDQLLGTFAQARDLLEAPTQVESREDLRQKLVRASGGIVFTTIQKFLPDERGRKFPLLSARRNIVVIADEAHRSQYDFVDGFARHLRDALPHASFLGFTGTPIEAEDKSTRQVFGDYIDTYDMRRAVEDGATVKIQYHSRLAKILLDPEETPRLDEEVDEVTEGMEAAVREKLKSRWARVEALVGAEKRVELIANDLVAHFERRLQDLDGKGMVVCMSRRICVDLYNAIVRLRPEWHSDRDEEGAVKVVMTGSATDPAQYHPHIRNKARLKALQKRVKDPADPLKLVIVRDMWLTGFDAPCLHTIYIDKPMHGHSLMQAIARVNRVFRDKPGGLVVDYLGVADPLRRALQNYTEADRRQVEDLAEDALPFLRERHEVVAAMLHGIDYSTYATGGHQNQMRLLLAGFNRVTEDPDTKERFVQATAELRKAFGLAGALEEAAPLRESVQYFLDIRGQVLKHTVTSGKDQEDVETAIRQIVSRAVSGAGVVDIFEAAGLQNPDISILSDEFLQEMRKMPHRNVQLELLRKLLNDEIRARARTNLVQARSFREMLEKAMRQYQNRAVEAAQVIDELVRLAREMRAARERGEQLGLTDDEVAFYDALATHDTARDVLGDDTLRVIARELVETIRRNISIDWTLKETVRAKLRATVRRLLRKHGYPPDKTEAATQTVLEQAELLCENWVVGSEPG
ncbi:MAG TPA: type I restriction endonuclease subunit R [Candidatus Thermoplasmatota archaeon]|nr:type I restriction endonuclease subunit R [Candidatus Thermoplasmatota archaeon]